MQDQPPPASGNSGTPDRPSAPQPDAAQATGAQASGAQWQSRAGGEGHWFGDEAFRQFAQRTATDVPAGWEDVLEPGEAIVWQGRPGSQPAWTELLDMRTLFGIGFAGFAVFMMLRIAEDPGPGGLPFNPMVLFGLPFLGVGLHLAGGQVLWDALVRRRSYYTLTDRAAYVASDLFGRRRIDRYPLARMALRLDGSEPGSIWFDSPQGGQGDAASGGSPALPRDESAGQGETFAGPDLPSGPPRSRKRPQAGFRLIPEARILFRVMTQLVAASRQQS